MPADRSHRRRSLVALVAVAALALPGCGGDGDAPQSQGDASAGPASGGDMLPAADVERVVRAQRQIAACREGADRRGVRAAAETLVAVYDDGPERIFEFGSSTRLGRPMQQVLEESVAGLRRCGDGAALRTVTAALDQD